VYSAGISSFLFEGSAAIQHSKPSALPTSFHNYVVLSIELSDATLSQIGSQNVFGYQYIGQDDFRAMGSYSNSAATCYLW